MTHFYFHQNRLLRFVVLFVAGLIFCPDVANALVQESNLKGRPIKEVRLKGLQSVTEQLVYNQIRTAPGDAYDPQVVADDVVRINHLNRFIPVIAKVEPLDDGSVIVIYEVTELPLLADVQVVGNKKISDQELLETIVVRAGDPQAPFLISRAVERIQHAYKQKGYFLVDVTVDEPLLNESGVLIFQVREGPRVKIKGMTFVGNQSYSIKQLNSKIRSKTHIPILRKGLLSREQIDADAAAIREFYRDQGYLEAECAGEIQVSPNYKNAVIAFTIKEGPRYLVDAIEVRFATGDQHVFSEDQVLRRIKLKVGDAFSEDKVRVSQAAIYDMYGKLGYIETRLVRADGREGMDRIFHENESAVDVVLTVNEGRRYLVGDVLVRGNQVTKQKVILRQLRGLEPGRPFDRTGLEQTRRRLQQSPLFSEAQVTVLGEFDQQVRDVLVEVREQNTGQINFGAGISSDSGVIGAIGLVQRNFDIADLPESPGEFFTGKAFRGAGQYFSVNVQPGNEFSQYSVTLREPYFLETPFFVEGSGFFFEREREDWDEQRLGANMRVGQRFGDVYTAAMRLRYEQIEVQNIDRLAPIDVFAVDGDSDLTAVEFALSRNTTDDGLFPTRGSNIRVTLGRTGALGGDYDFTKIDATFQKFWTVDEDFFGRRSVFSIRVRGGYIFEEDEAPVFERFYAGGARTMRGFDFRGVGPRGLVRRSNGTTFQGDDPVGGDFLFLFGAEYNFPIFEEFVRGVVFTDTGTVAQDVDFNEYRASIGAGLRLTVPFLGRVPVGLDVAYPILKEDDDDVRVFSFDVSLPLR